MAVALVKEAVGNGLVEFHKAGWSRQRNLERFDGSVVKHWPQLCTSRSQQDACRN